MMNAGDYVRALLLVSLGAGATAVGVLLGGRPQDPHIQAPSLELAALSKQLSLLEEAIRAIPASPNSGVPAVSPAESVQPVRTIDATQQLVGLLEELRDSIQVISASRVHIEIGHQGGVAKKSDVLVNVLKADESDRSRLRQRHFCSTKLDVYAEYGMPDIVSGAGPGISIWRYRVSDSGPWLVFTFTDGLVTDVDVPN